MARTNPNDLIAFNTIARERSFTRAAAKPGVSPSVLSHTMAHRAGHAHGGGYGAVLFLRVASAA
jgi:regulatory helix-turn-helix LysR family protein